MDWSGIELGLGPLGVSDLRAARAERECRGKRQPGRRFRCHESPPALVQELRPGTVMSTPPRPWTRFYHPLTASRSGSASMAAPGGARPRRVGHVRRQTSLHAGTAQWLAGRRSRLRDVDRLSDAVRRVPARSRRLQAGRPRRDPDAELPSVPDRGVRHA